MVDHEVKMDSIRYKKDDKEIVFLFIMMKVFSFTSDVFGTPRHTKFFLVSDYYWFM